MTTTKELLNVPGLEPNQIVTIRKLGFGSLSRIRTKAAIASINAKTKSINASVDMGEYMKYVVVYGIVSAPFFENATTEDSKVRVIEQDLVSAQTGEYLFNEIEKFNNMVNIDETKKKFD